MMKQLTLLGFFTSKTGMTETLRHVPVPGHYDGACPIKKAIRPGQNNNIITIGLLHQILIMKYDRRKFLTIDGCRSFWACLGGIGKQVLAFLDGSGGKKEDKILWTSIMVGQR